jgi:NADH-quinone oxidoreductase subunit N
MIDWLSILPHMVLAGGGFLLFCIGAFLRPRSPGVLLGAALLAVLSAAAGVLLITPETNLFLEMLEVRGYGRFFAFVICAITVLTLLFCHEYARVRGVAGDELYGLILLAALGMILVAGAVHWLTFFLGLELLSLSLYILISVRKADPASNEAALKYFIMGSVASAFLTFGIAILYALTGTLSIGKSLAGGLPAGSASLVFLGLSFILAGIGFKISMVPFHLWTPDVYQGAPAPITAFLSTGSKVALFAALLRMASNAGGEIWSYFTPVLWVLAVLTMGVGNISALAQLRVKRLLAYSSIGQMGYLLMALLAVKQNGPSAIMFYLAAYALMDLGAFGSLALLSPPGADLDNLEDCQGLAYSHPWRSGILAVSLISLAGLPPTAGFIGKFALFWAVLEARYVVIAVIGILTVVLSIYFYFKIVVALFMRPGGKTFSISPLSLSDRAAGVLILVLILFLGLIPGPLLSIIGSALPYPGGP